jgi:hypothetical protein
MGIVVFINLEGAHLNICYPEFLRCLGPIALCRYLQREGLPCVTYLMAVFCVHLVIL